MKKLSKSERVLIELREYNKRQRRYGLSEKTLDEYLRIKNGKSRYKPKGVTSPLQATTLRRESPIVPSGDGLGRTLPKKEEKKYTGDNLIGIGTMHKSNMVPIFKGEDAEDIAKMRRN